jgi:ABC-type multidrug transport system ATPase subunit
MLGSSPRGDDVEKKKSFQERNRLRFVNYFTTHKCWLMDEPTNHLDIKSKNVLKAALKNMKEPCFWYLTTGIFFKVCLISFMSSEIKR